MRSLRLASFEGPLYIFIKPVVAGTILIILILNITHVNILVRFNVRFYIKLANHEKISISARVSFIV